MSRDYMKGYYAGSRNSWPAHRTPRVPDELQANIIAAATGLRDEADALCATWPEDDELAVRLSAKIDAFDEAMAALGTWLRKPTLADSPAPSDDQQAAKGRTRTHE